MNDLNKGLEDILERYNVSGAGRISKENITLEKEGVIIPLLPWRNERRFIELKNLANDGTLCGISAMRTCRIEKESMDIDSIIYREFDLCEWLLGSDISSIYAVSNKKKATNIIVQLKSGVMCTIEVATTLSKDTDIIDKHEIIAKRGVACDRVVDTQMPQKSIYVFTDKKDPDTYIDVDFELYGYDIEEIAIIRQAFELIGNDELAKNFIQREKHLNQLVRLSQTSVDTSSNIIVEVI
jgi:hypothetical protein